MTLQEEQDIISICQREPKAFGILFDEYYNQIFGYIHRRVLDWDASEDITAEVFMKAFMNITNYRWLGISIAAWFYRIATNEINMYFRKDKKAPISLAELSVNQNFDYSETNQDILENDLLLQQHEDFLQVQKHLKNLDIKYQEVIALRFFEDKSIREIGEILNKNEGTIKSLLSRGLEKIRSKISK
jgi:RNA polymerase sigma-70 factor, ECF subfamily